MIIIRIVLLWISARIIIKSLKKLANENRKRIIDLVYFGKSGHPGGALSIIDMLTAIYELDVDLNAEKRQKSEKK